LCLSYYHQNIRHCRFFFAITCQDAESILT